MDGGLLKRLDGLGKKVREGVANENVVEPDAERSRIERVANELISFFQSSKTKKGLDVRYSSIPGNNSFIFHLKDSYWRGIVELIERADGNHTIQVELLPDEMRPIRPEERISYSVMTAQARPLQTAFKNEQGTAFSEQVKHELRSFFAGVEKVMDDEEARLKLKK